MGCVWEHEGFAWWQGAAMHWHLWCAVAIGSFCWHSAPRPFLLRMQETLDSTGGPIPWQRSPWLPAPHIFQLLPGVSRWASCPPGAKTELSIHQSLAPSFVLTLRWVQSRLSQHKEGNCSKVPELSLARPFVLLLVIRTIEKGAWCVEILLCSFFGEGLEMWNSTCRNYTVVLKRR